MTGKLTQRLTDPVRSGVYRASTDAALAHAAGEGGLDYVHVPLQDVRGKDALLEALARSLAFPDWFGKNWDALEDCLSDLSWRAEGGRVIALAGFEGVGNDELGILIDVLASSAEHWAGRGRPFFAVFIDPRRALGLADLYRDA